jgi:exopolysaccharide production protein ExoZ
MSSHNTSLDPTKAPPSIRIKSLDAGRGIAALLVVQFHITCPFIDGGHQIHKDEFLYKIGHYGNLGVTFFFVLSGFLITLSAIGLFRHNVGHGIRKYCRARVRRIFPPYWACLALVLTMGLLSMFTQSYIGRFTRGISLLDPMMWLTNLTLSWLPFGQKELLSVSWTLCYEVAFYLMIALIYACTYRATNHRARISFFANLILAVTIISAAMIPFKFCKPLALFPLDLWYQFGIGSLIACDFTTKQNIKSGFPTRSVVAMGFITVMAFMASPDQHIPHDGRIVGFHPPLIHALSCVFFAIFVMVLCRYDDMISNNRALKPLLFMGTISYSLYLTHMLVIPVIITRLRNMGLDGGLYWIAALIMMLSCTCFAWVFHHIFERRFVSSQIGGASLQFKSCGKAAG